MSLTDAPTHSLRFHRVEHQTEYKKKHQLRLLHYIATAPQMMKTQKYHLFEGYLIDTFISLIQNS